MPLFGCPGPSRLVPLVGFLWLVSLAGQVGGSPLAGLNFHCIFYMLRNSNNKSKQSGICFALCVACVAHRGLREEAK